MSPDFMELSDDIEVRLDDPQVSAEDHLKISVQELQQIKDFIVEVKATPTDSIEDLYDEANRIVKILDQYV